jgi:antitoxin FitA
MRGTSVGISGAEKTRVTGVDLQVDIKHQLCVPTVLTKWTQIEIIDINGLMESRMAGNLHVRNLDDDLIARLKRRAARHGRSTEAEHREILRQALAGEDEPSFDKLAADLRKLTKRRKQTPSELLLRGGRDER